LKTLNSEKEIQGNPRKSKPFFFDFLGRALENLLSAWKYLHPRASFATWTPVISDYIC